MKLNVTAQAAKWYKEEFEPGKNAHLRLFVRYGFGGRIPGFSLGVSSAAPDHVYASATTDGITFFIEEKDAWYFDDHSLTIQMDQQEQEPEFVYG
ncbi:HesB/YadR/YfhF family protein [Lentibacillus juripiscarius]|uniref:HesB/YadR/YfhF family protein n=1 Tax=Lentibacillus juripiscarius TaxID=257446 RepID=A0ABW5V656_9BACI